ncbi:MAG: T9SS type A sorting domain-containing protein [Ignavibacteriaceae bacterium]|nr:T9SS type A sorting domain-containing protein [Ignavibacteriaceae bacterium]
MKKVILPILIFVLTWSIKSFSQDVMIQSFDNFKADTSFSWTSNVEGGNSYFRVSQDSTDFKEGAASMVISTEIDSLHAWGSYSQLIWSAPTGTSLDWSSSDTLRLWIKIVKAPVYPQYMSFRIQLRDNGATGTDAQETYIYQNDVCLDAAGDWFLLKVPLHQINSQSRTVTPGDSGFVVAPGSWGGFTYNDDKLNIDKITGWNIVCVTTTTSLNPNPPAGFTNVPADSLVMKIDGFMRTGNKPVPMVIFNGITVSNFCSGWTWGNAALSVAEGAGPVANSNAVQWIMGDQYNNGWNGIGWNIAPAFNLSGSWATDSLKFMMKTNAVADSFRVQLENGVGKVGYIFNSPADTNWHQYSLPLRDFVTEDGATGFDPAGVSVFGFMSQHDSALGIAGKTVLFTNVWTGNPVLDVIPPAAPAGVSVVKNSDYTNTIIWTDVPGKTDATYNIYYSLNPITDITASGVEVATTGVVPGIEYYVHQLKAPGTDQSVSYYYAVVCKSGAGIMGVPGGSGSAVTNTAKGVTDINPTAPASFVADGDLTEWANIKPFRLYTSDHSGTPVSNSKISSDTVSSGDIYIAVDKDYLYVAAHINTNNIYTGSSTSYQNTSFDLLLGLYDWHGASHTSLLTGAKPDYHFRFCFDRVLVDNNGTDSLEVPGANYFWGSRFPDPLAGYNVEAKIAWTDIAHKRAGSTYTGTDNVFVPAVGMRIPVDIELNSVTEGATARDGQLDYSPIAQGNSWSNVALWAYTWIGDQWTTPVKDTKQTVYSYKLSQNYPNPFNPTTNIQYSIVKSGHVTLTIYDILGRKIATLINQNQEAGNHTINFNASRFASGVYFYRIEAGDFTSVKKMMLLK